MGVTILLKRGTTDANNRYTGLEGELTLDLEAKGVRMHDGVTPGGVVITAPSELGDGYALPANLGPGPQTLIAGDATNGFFGELVSNDFFSSSVLHNNVFIDQSFQSGTITEVNDGWLKFIIDGKILYTPKKFLNYGLSWEALYHNGAVYGTGDIGVNPPPSGERVQDCVVSTEYLGIGDNNQYKVRLFTGAEKDPTTFGNEYFHQHMNGAVNQSEWNRMLLAVHDKMYTGVDLPKLAQYTTEELGFTAIPTLPDLGNAAAGTQVWCQESSPDYTLGTTPELNRRVYRGMKDDPDYFHSTTLDGSGMNQIDSLGWRPILELIQ